jgi:glyoxylase-like metal-dependent hydrolase (beta-lactamase superfamily II)
MKERMSTIPTRGGTWLALVVALGLAAGVMAPRVTAQAGEDGGLDVVKVRKNFYMIAGAGGNIGVQIGSDGIVLVNSGNGQASAQVIAALKKLTDLPIRYIINTDGGREFVGGNEALSKAGFTIFTNALGNTGFVGAMTNGGAAAILAHEGILSRMTKENYSANATPTEAFYAPRKALRMNDEGIEVLHQPPAHSDTDAFVLFRGSDVVVTGDVMDMTRFPAIDLEHGGSIQGEIDALNKLIDLTIAPTPFIYKDVGTYVIPGHGRLAEQMEVVDYRDMVVTVHDVIADLIAKKKTLEQIKAARPALPYETRYGSKTATDAFVEAVYKSLSGQKPSTASAPAAPKSATPKSKS